jgi:acetyl-CoA synthetase
MSDKAIEVLLQERRSFPPPKALKKSAHVRSEQVFAKARKDPKAFWVSSAKEIEWFKPWKKVLEWDSPWAKWFIGGNIKLQRRLYILLSF